jgi:hypothetical protein
VLVKAKIGKAYPIRQQVPDDIRVQKIPYFSASFGFSSMPSCIIKPG